MVILSTIEFLGFLVSENGKLGASEENIESAFAFKGYFPDIYRGKSKIFSVVYRHGMMHSAFPKHIFNNEYYAICKALSEDLFIEQEQGSYRIKSLKVKVFSKDFRFFLIDCRAK